MTSPITIVGAGLAAYNLARELRKLSPDAALRIICADDGAFYSKPMLSTGLAGNKTAAQLAMKSADKMAEELRAEIVSHTTVTQIDPAARTIDTPAGQFHYGDLVLALGADPVRLPLSGEAAEQVISVNDLQDYAHYRERLAGKQRVVLLGAGLIGCEFANDLLTSGHQVTVVDLAAWPLSRLLPEAAGRWMQTKLQAAGADFRLGRRVQSVDGQDGDYRLTLDDGTVIEADLVVSAVGLAPRTQLARAAGLVVERGIVVDRYLRSSDPHIYALGDCAQVAGWLLPFVQPIMQSARALAATLAGQAAMVTYPAMPVLVKTPASPLVVSPPPPGAVGEWLIEEQEGGLRARYLVGEVCTGFVLLGAATAERAQMAAQLPAWLA
ncbi:NAD(P)/FAD-dependent oxidoreductase [Chitinimonas sp. BJYL2]|uniref:NAD(P)/FAD-dependent oxidoreductase n=1 Tax=Chitinimonas sp. BJYL2 TaxID=2976696 RepID=UPI0022B4355D|nr:FAD-dependent oxidoreductase [Chitinimonas sp. BJYL2]